jgi:hypothetical protein
MENTFLLTVGLMMAFVAVRIMVNNSLNRRRREKRPAFVSPTPSTGHTLNYNMNYDFNDEFYLNLKKTIWWTEDIISRIEDVSKINYAKILRTTNPVYNERPFYTMGEREDDIYVSTPPVGFDYKAVLKEALSVRTNTNLRDQKLEEMGRILQFEIDITTHDGAPCAENGFVDESDIPPIDTWFHITQKYLYCWIPTMFVEIMQNAIDVEIFGSYVWLDEMDPQLHHQIIQKLQQNG